MSKRIKIVYVIPSLEYGGAERQLIELVRHIDKTMFAVVIVLLTRRDSLLADAYTDIYGLRVVRLKSTGKYNLSKLIELKRLYKNEQADIIHTILPTANFWGCLSGRLCKSSKIVASSRGLHYKVLNRWSLINFLSLNFLAHHVIVNSKAVEKNCEDFLKVKRDKIVRIVNGVNTDKDDVNYDEDMLCRKFGIAQRQQPIISSIGRMDPLKGHEFLVESAAILNNRGVKAYFLIAGEGPLGQSLKDRVRRLGLDDRVKFVGQVQDIRQIMCVSDIFVLPTISEGCSNVILEAMAAGLAIVTTSIPANKELIENNHSGLLVPTRDPAKMADAIEHLINSPESAKKLGEKAQQKVTNDFSIEDMIAKYEQFYLAIAGMGGLIESS